MTHARIVFAVAALAGCSKVLGIDSLSGPPSDGSVSADAPGDAGADAAIPMRITVSGITTREGGGNPTPLGGVEVVYFTAANVNVAGTASGPDGVFSLSLPTEGRALDGYLRATAPNGEAVVTIQYFARPLVADTPGITTRSIESGLLGQFATFCAANFEPATGVVVAMIRDPLNNGVSGETVTTQPAGRYCSLGDGGLPTQTNVTGTRGDVFSFQVATGTATANVIHNTGSPLPGRAVTVRPGTLTIVPFVP